MHPIIASGLLNLGLNFLLIPKYGYVAAAITNLISYIFFQEKYPFGNFPLSL